MTDFSSSERSRAARALDPPHPLSAGARVSPPQGVRGRFMEAHR